MTGLLEVRQLNLEEVLIRVLVAPPERQGRRRLKR